MAYTADSAARYSLLEWQEQNYLSFLRHLPTLCRKGCIYPTKPFKDMVESITVQLVSNYAVSDDVRDSVQKDLRRHLSGFRLPRPVAFELKTTLEVIAEVIEAECKSPQGRRYGHPVLDLARELEFRHGFSG